MSDDKTEQPTEEKLRKSKQKGQVAQVKNQVIATSMISGSFLLYGSWSSFVEPYMKAVDLSFSNLTVSPIYKLSLARDILLEIVVVKLGMIFAAMTAIIFLSTLLYNKFTVSMESMKPKFDKFNPVQGVKKIFKLDSLYNTIYTLIVSIVFAISLYLILRLNFEDLIMLYHCEEGCKYIVLNRIILQVIVSASLILGIIAVIDVPFQTLLFKKGQKMTKDEVKKENKEMMGSPEIIMERKSIGEEIVFGFDPKDVSIVICGGEVALAYIFSSEEGTLPYLYKKVVGPDTDTLKESFIKLGAKVHNDARLANKFAAQNTNEDYLPPELFEEFAPLIQAYGL